LAGENSDVGQILTRANRVLNEDIGSEHFVTLLFVMLDPKARTIRYASAGHPPGLWLDQKGKPKPELPRTGIPLGLRPDTEYGASEELLLKKGDLLALMTDGVEESISAQGELFGKKRIMEMLVDKQSARASKIVAHLHQAGRDYEAADQQPDDFTTIVLKVK
jgi:sigma-B regulation protein RsbU (phosphoserine phosphatase)